MQNDSKIFGKFGKMTGRVEFLQIQFEIKKMIDMGHSIKYIFQYFFEQKKFTQSYPTFLRYVRKPDKKNTNNLASSTKHSETKLPNPVRQISNPVDSKLQSEQKKSQEESRPEKPKEPIIVDISKNKPPKFGTIKITPEDF